MGVLFKVCLCLSVSVRYTFSFFYSFPTAFFKKIIPWPKNVHLGPPSFVLANSKCVEPVTMFSKAMLQTSELDSMNCM